MVNPIAVALVVILLRWAYKALKAPSPKICGLVGGPPITSPRVKLSDGRHLAYREFGVPKEEARYKIIVIHGFHSFKDINLPVSQFSQIFPVTDETEEDENEDEDEEKFL